MYRYLIIESISPIEQNESTLLAFFSDIIRIDDVTKRQHQITLFYQGDAEVSFKDIIINLSSDTLTDFRLFESCHFKTELERYKNYEHILGLLKRIEIVGHPYVSEQDIVSLLIHDLTDQDISCFLKSYAKDQTMLNSVKIYLECNQNTSVAAKQLFVHRNTLIHRIDKFIDITGFDIREFVPGYLIYSLLTSH